MDTKKHTEAAEIEQLERFLRERAGADSARPIEAPFTAPAPDERYWPVLRVSIMERVMAAEAAQVRKGSAKGVSPKFWGQLIRFVEVHTLAVSLGGALGLAALVAALMLPGMYNVHRNAGHLADTAPHAGYSIERGSVAAATSAQAEPSTSAAPSHAVESDDLASLDDETELAEQPVLMHSMSESTVSLSELSTTELESVLESIQTRN